MSKKITIALQGKDLVLNFGVNYFYKYFKEATGIDLYAASFDIALKAEERKRQLDAAEKEGKPAPEENGFGIYDTTLYKLISTTDQFIYASGILYAGYASEKSVNKQPIELDYKYFEDAVYSMNEAEVSSIVDKYNEAKKEETGEV